MKNFNFKQSVLKARWLFTMTLLLTLGVGQMWAAGQYNMNWKGKVYFRAPNDWDISTYSTIQVALSRTTSTSASNYICYIGTMTRISNTRLFYLSINADHSSWGQNEYIFFTANNSTYGSGTFTINTNHYYTTPCDYGCNNASNYYLFNPSSEGQGASVSGSWNSTRNTLMKLSNTIAVKVKKAGSASYTTPSSTSEMPASSVGVTAYYVNADNGSTSNEVSLSGSTYSTTFNGSPGGKITLSQTAKSGFTFDGYYVSSSSISSPYDPTSASAITIEARYTEVASTVSLVASPTGKGSFTIGGAAATSTTAGVTTTRSVTAVPISGYHFVSWAVSGGATISSTTTNPTTVTGKGAGESATLTATFAADDVYSLTVAAGTGISAVTGSTNDIKAAQNIAITATVATGYTWNTWTKTGAGTLSTFTAGTKNQTVTVGTAGDITLTASATENMSSLSTSCHYDAGNPSYAIPTKSASSIGIATTSTLTATAASTGYTFAGWTLSSNLVVTSGNASTDRTITVRTNGNGAAATAQANYNEVLTQDTWVIKGGTAFGGTAWTTEHALAKQSGHSTESVVYKTFTISSTNTGDSNDNFKFKVVKKGATDAYFGLTADGSYYLNRSESGTEKTLATENADIQLRADVAGDYIFKVDYSTPASPKLTITFPTSYTLTYDIGTVKGTSGSISTSPTTASGSKVLSGNSVTLTGPAAKTGYTWKGWYTNAAGTEGKITDTDRAITVTMNADKTLYACYTENQYNVAVSAGSNGSVSPSGTVAVKQVSGTSITASPNTGYHFTNWTISGGGITPTTSSTSPQTFKATTTGGSITANFAETTHTVNVVSGNTYLGSVSTASVSSIGIATASGDITATPATGATFSSWSLPSGVTAAAGYSASSNPIRINATADSKTITANFTETMHSVTLTNDNSTYGTVNTSSPVSVGRITAVQIQATAKTNYMFSGWVKTGGAGTVTYYTGAGTGQLVDETGASKATTYICVTGDVTLKATWEEDRSSGYVVHYGNDGKNADEQADASQTRAWQDGVLNKPSIAESNTSSFVFTASTADVDKVIYFKIKKLSPETWYGNTGKITGSISDWTFSTGTKDARLCITMPGNYTFTWDKSTNKLSVTYPSVYYLRGGFNSWDWSLPMTETSSGVYSATVNMTEANHTYSGDNGFKLLIAGQYYGKNSTTVTRSTSTGSAAISPCSTSGANIGITTDYTGNYTFTYTVATNTLQVTYPTAYKVTYGKGTVDGSASTCSAVDIDNGDASVTSNSTWVKSGNRVVLTAPAAKSGYRYLGWYDNNSATGAAITTNANCTITVSSALTRYACYAENLSSITVSAGVGGTVSKGSGTHSLGVTTGVAIDATPSTGYSWSTWTTSGNAALGTTASTKSNTAKGNGTNGGSGTITATFTPNHYDVILDVNGGSGDNQTVDATFAAAMPTVQKGGSTPIAARSRTGYNFDGYWANNTGTGTQYYTSALASNHNWDVATNNTHIYAKWNAKQSAITFDYQTGVAGYSSSGNITNASGLKGTYDAAMTALTGTMPSASNGYAFTGFYDATSGGTKYYNADGTSAHTWDKDTESGTTLYARWEKAEVAEITFSPGTVVENNATVTVTATISPTPVGTTTVCWRVLRSDGTALDPQPAFDPVTAQGTSVSFTAPNASGMYKVEAKLRTGSACGAGTLLDTEVADFQVAGSHTVTVAYKHSSTTIKASTSVTGRPLVWSDPITAPEIFGYTFDHWTAGDGITLSEDGESDLGDDESTSTTIYIKAIYNGTLTANYTPKNIIYFKDNLEWTDPEDADAHIYVNLLTADYWNTDNGTGNEGVTNRNLEMSRVPGTTDIFYYDYGNKTTSNYISFTKESMNGYTHFYQSGTAHVVFPSRALDALGTDNATGLGFYAATPMFVPLATQTPVKKNSNHATYYNDGYWTKYLPGTGYTLQIYNSAGNSLVKEVAFTSADELMPMKVVTDLEGGHTYKFQLKRDGDVYYGNNGTMTYADHGQNTAWDFFHNSPFNMCTIVTTAAGDYTFNLSYSPNSGGTNNRLRISVDYPVSDGDYRLVYKDDVHTKMHPSAIVNKVNDGTDIVSFFVRKDENPKLYIQQATVNPSTGAITWNEYPTSGTPTNQITGAIASAITTDTVYNFNLSMNGSGALTVASAEYYSGNYYIRTDAANSKWDNYRTDPDHLMTYSDYLKTDVGYSHYYTHWVRYTDTGRKNVKFVIANDYSPCISDTLAREEATGTWANIATFMEEGGDLKRSANVRFMWDIKTNAIARAYIDGAQEDGTHFLELLSADGKIKNTAETETLTAVTFSDNGNWIYEANIKAQPNAQIKLKSTWGEGTTIVQYFKGAADETEPLIAGSGDNWYPIRVLYDFKTNRLVAAYVPTTGTYNTEDHINADVMFIREHQGDIAQLTFGGSGAISDIKTAYGVLRLNKWTINNKAKAEPHSPLYPELSRYERDLFYISFPFRVNLEEVFGFGTYGTHWIVEEYDGAGRAANGFWKDTPTFWRFITNRKGKFLEPNIGYIVALDLDELGETSSVWANTDQVELYFPSYGSMPDIKSSSVTHEVPAHTCTINRPTPQGDRRVKDSHWNVMSVPTYINTNNVSFANTDWITTADKTHVGPNFLYIVDWTDNSLYAESGTDYTYKAMHAYIVQYCGNVTWTTSVSPALAPRRNPDAPKDAEFCIELQQNEAMIDRTFVRLTDDEAVTSGFEFNYDMSKEFNKNKANIYTMVTTIMEDGPSVTETAGNCLPLTDQTTIVPMGVQIATNGDYTFSIPSGTNGVGVTLVDNETGIRTNLALMDYTIALEAGTQDDRFYLEISPIKHVATDIENTDAGDHVSSVRKMMVDGLLYIIKDGKVFDAHGARVK